MANYSVRIFKRSGYNIINTPDTPERLAADSIPEDLPSVNILQNRRLKSILVACTNESAQDADYIKIGNMYYAITDFAMQSVSTCLFSIVEKPLLSVGGVKAVAGGASARFEILDGITSRCTVKDDSWGAYTSDDPLTAPQEPLVLQTEWLNDSTGKSHIFIESLVELCTQGTPNFREGITYTDEETGETCTMPQTASLPMDSVTKVTQHTNFTTEGVTDTRGSQIYWKDDPKTDSDTTISASATIQNGLDTIRSLGQEQGSIIGQYKVPDKFLGDITVIYSGITGEATSTTVPIIGTRQDITDIKGASGKFNSHISPDYAPVKNKRVLYGAYNKYGMITCAGNSAEFNPEDLGGEEAPEITYKSDPKPDGCPYYRFTTINGNTEFWRNSIKGCTWENVPLVYQGASGSALTRLNFDNERAMKSLQADQFDKNYGFTLFNNITQGIKDTAAAGFEGAAVGGTPGAIAGVAEAGITAGVGIAQSIMSRDQYFERYNQEKANELSGLYQATDVYAPTINFPYNAKLLQVIKGNGVLVYKYHMSANDTKRVDKLLTMYGYKNAEPLTLENFQRREHFDYVACSTVSVTGDYPRWLLDDIADELKNGIRIWHTKPDSSAYNDNPVRS